MQTYTLKMSGLTLEEAKELAENGSTFMWAKEGDDIVAIIPSFHHSIIPSYLVHFPKLTLGRLNIVKLIEIKNWLIVRL